jgi:hypothetical protein
MTLFNETHLHTCNGLQVNQGATILSFICRVRPRIDAVRGSGGPVKLYIHS